MFWWLYFTTADPSTNPPLIIWLQGGPGGSSVGFGNFAEIGPLDVNLKNRSTTWLQKASLLFIDNPVGSGYSYVDNDDAYTTNVTGIANDLMTLLKTFLQKQPSFQDVPLWIFTESYGGKMTAAFSQKLVQAIQSGEIKANFKGCALGDSWISPIDSLLSWGPYLYHTSLVDKPGLAQVNAGAQKAKQLLDEGQYAEATTEFGILEDIIEEVTDGVNVYNILQFDQDGPQSRKHHKGGFKLFDRLYNRHVGVYYANDDLSELMNGPIKKKLGIPENVTWGGQSENVFAKQAVDFMKSVQDIVDDLISNTSLEVVVYSGQLDLIVDSIGTEAWVNNLKWSGLSTWNATQWQSVKVNEQRTGFYKTFKNFSFFWILKAGHMVPADAGETALKMVEMVIAKGKL
ncbi:putative retinoid-inducible serine carboxypeptidase [Apostichopus japonicus]|uniref:Carboxypeptidase n=1 Tax=Stichopus japonicus TaxID=307972 RepID=A0A2G8JMF6_STIJA|nr:putative retinoid-inducible serine carboxypeptidase [Apostichopus japonicus]